MIKTILWDFDGVIFNSMKIKADGFLELFKEYDDLLLKKIEEYHYLWQLDAKAYVDGNIVAEAELKAMIMDK
jgi:beta-phosphoglucomutase-like phosphatase (HAD superfamily)